MSINYMFREGYVSKILADVNRIIRESKTDSDNKKADEVILNEEESATCDDNNIKTDESNV